MDLAELKNSIDQLTEQFKNLNQRFLELQRGVLVIAQALDFNTRDFDYNIDPDDDTQYSDAIELAVAHIELNYKSTITLTDLSFICGLTREHVCRKFKNEVGMSFVDYLNKIRTDKAKEYLVNPYKKVKDIAGLCGFTNPVHFAKIFKQFVGCTPTEFRERSQK